ncbi:MAG: glycoside hydrolase family 32 protein, partial [Acidobacteria bacterium]|nr:glycoside hydrolase family 32 protein [Acidobacteriota bacterium]
MHDDFPGSVFRRRTILQSIAALTLAPVLSDLALGSEGSGDVAARKSRRLRIDRNFVLFPINNESLSRRVRLVKDGRVLRSFTASLGLPARWWAHLDVSAWQGQTLSLSVEPDNSPSVLAAEIPGRGASETDNAELVAAIRTSAEIWSPETLYKEPLRPAFHFTSRRGWNNDPNGLMYHAGQYHLFFQHNPYGVRWGNMHWGHAVSTDLVHWKELPIALYPHGDDDFPFSGSGAVDHENTSGWGKNGRPPMVIAFTSTGRGECIAYSEDDGATWKEFDGNPVVKHSGRDPKLLWHPQTKQWVMAVYSERPGADPAAPKREGIAFYTSADLKSWQERSWIEGYYECPDLFALPIDGDANRTKWVLSCAPSYYCIGEFDGSRFIPESPQLPAPAGGGSNAQGPLAAPFPLFYAAQTFSDHPQGHRVQIAWGRVEAVDAPFTQLMSFPTALSLRTTSEGVRLCREPVEAIRSLRAHTYDLPAGPLTPSPLLTDLKGEAWDIEAVIRVGTVSPILMSIGGDEYVYQSASQMLSGPRGAMPIPLTDGRLQLRVLVDRTTVEIFGDRGQAYGMF